MVDSNHFYLDLDTDTCPSCTGNMQCCGAGAGAGAGGAATFCWSRSQSFFGPAPEPGMLILLKCYKNPQFFILKVEIDFKNHNFVAIYFKEPFDYHICLLKT
jgi:hypothetical protein